MLLRLFRANRAGLLTSRAPRKHGQLLLEDDGRVRPTSRKTPTSFDDPWIFVKRSFYSSSFPESRASRTKDKHLCQNTIFSILSHRVFPLKSLSDIETRCYKENPSLHILRKHIPQYAQSPNVPAYVFIRSCKGSPLFSP